MLRPAPLVVPSLALALALASACGPEQEEAAGTDACEVGSALSSEIERELTSVSATCQSAADCVRLELTLDCAGNRVAGCGIVLHRDVVEQFDPGEANARFCSSIRPSKFGCSISPQCAATTLACEAGRCAGKLAVGP